MPVLSMLSSETRSIP